MNKSVTDAAAADGINTDKIDTDELIKQQQNLVKELEHVRSQLQVSQMVNIKQTSPTPILMAFTGVNSANGPSPMAMDPHPWQQHAGPQHAVLWLQQEAT